MLRGKKQEMFYVEVEEQGQKKPLPKQALVKNVVIASFNKSKLNKVVYIIQQLYGDNIVGALASSSHYELFCMI